MNKKELLLLNQFRANARENLTKASRRTGVPVSTIYDKLRKYEGSLIKKHTALLDFNALGFALRAHIAIKSSTEHKKALTAFLENHHRVNSLYKVTSGFDLLLEGIFRNLKEYKLFCDDIEKFKPIHKQDFFIIEDIKQEAFLTQKEYVDIIAQTM